ncbi:uncharacterized protein PV09_05099 [Verruconis gallopava]|uniref:Uncharacterized protein n=1 Tax=Verruconis gallopava TaxID=253628 RepID=A0A0D2AAJ5_9PEZI|nr:uncharacterized protein PV09_05099 [Verruconis gallopava]KIW03798.1 hypothetical protein PV09_05099 [Verruconis gallopava]
MYSGGYTSGRSPLSINTSNAEATPQGRDNRRFSYTETPIDAQPPAIFGRAQNFNPEQETLHEVVTPIDATGVDENHVQNSSSPMSGPYTIPPSASMSAIAQHQLAVPQQTSSPYGVPEPERPHPAFSIPVMTQGMQAETTSPRQQPRQPSQAAAYQTQHSHAFQPQVHNNPDAQVRQRDSAVPISTENDERYKLQLSTKSFPVQSDHVQVPYSPHCLTSPTHLVFTPDAPSGPNGMVPEMHQPGQITHPNMQNLSSSVSDKSPFIHSLCECNTDVCTCLTGLFFPCILDSKTAYRLERRSEKKDPTDLLGFSNCNCRCGLMAVFGLCGLCCIFPLTLRARIRHVYKLQGSFTRDVRDSCCCCCLCVAIQNEREVRDRENRIRQNAGPTMQYPSDSIRMTYTPGAR